MKHRTCSCGAQIELLSRELAETKRLHIQACHDFIESQNMLEARMTELAIERRALEMASVCVNARRPKYDFTPDIKPEYWREKAKGKE